MPKRGRVVAMACLALSVPREALALEYCVTCEGPPAMYRCVIDGTKDGPGTNPSMSLYCISEMASRGHHESCAVSRGAPFPCPGLTALVQQPAQLPTLAEPPPGAPDDGNAVAVPAEPQPKEPEQAKPAKVPRTVEELAGETVKSTKQGLQKAGEAIGGTTKKAGEQIGNAGSALGNAATKTWTCITSFFSSCGGESDAEQSPEEQQPAH